MGLGMDGERAPACSCVPLSPFPGLVCLQKKESSCVCINPRRGDHGRGERKEVRDGMGWDGEGQGWPTCSCFISLFPSPGIAVYPKETSAPLVREHAGEKRKRGMDGWMAGGEGRGWPALCFLSLFSVVMGWYYVRKENRRLLGCHQTRRRARAGREGRARERELVLLTRALCFLATLCSMRRAALLAALYRAASTTMIASTSATPRKVSWVREKGPNIALRSLLFALHSNKKRLLSPRSSSPARHLCAPSAPSRTHGRA